MSTKHPLYRMWSVNTIALVITAVVSLSTACFAFAHWFVMPRLAAESQPAMQGLLPLMQIVTILMNCDDLDDMYDDEFTGGYNQNVESKALAFLLRQAAEKICPKE